MAEVTTYKLLQVMHGYILENYPDMNWEDRWDMVQDVWIKYHLKRHDVDWPQAYCIRSIKNLFIDRWRERECKPRATLTRHNDVDPVDFTEAIHETVDQQEHWNELVSILSDREREFLSLYWDGLSFSNGGSVSRGQIPWVAGEMGCSEGAAKQILTRIRRKARDIKAGRPVCVNKPNYDLSRGREYVKL